VDVKRILLANAMQPLPGNQPLVDAIQKHGEQCLANPSRLGTPLYTDVRLFCEPAFPA
jgi:succinyl-diaminopimelate desuccinylase